MKSERQKNDTSHLTWRRDAVERCKAEIKKSIEAAELAQGPHGRLKHIISKLKDAQSDSGPDSMLKVYVYCLSALVHHDRYGGLTAKEVKQAYSLALDILRINGIRAQEPSYSYLYGDVHYILGQINRRNGDHWPAMWEHLLGCYLAKSQGAMTDGSKVLASANRALRLGYSNSALSFYESAERDLAQHSTWQLCRLGRIKTLRLSHRLAEAAELLAASKSHPSFTEAGRQELVWEELCLECLKDQNLNSMINAVQLRNGSHAEGGYYLEAMAWAHAVSKREYIFRFGKLHYTIRSKSIDLRSQGYFLESVEILENLYDNEIPIDARIEKVGACLALSNKLLSIDKELLITAATIRWLGRVKAQQFGQMVLQKYRATSLALTEGRSADALGILSDLMQREWSNVPDTLISPAV